MENVLYGLKQALMSFYHHVHTVTTAGQQLDLAVKLVPP